MNRAEFNEAVEAKMVEAGHPIESHAQTNRITSACVDIIRETLTKGDDVQWSGFGTFKTYRTKARIVNNGLTGKPIDVPAKNAVKFVPSKLLKDDLN